MKRRGPFRWDPGKGHKRNRFIEGAWYRCNRVSRFATRVAGRFIYRIYLRCRNKDEDGQQCPCNVIYDSNIWPDTPESVHLLQTEREHTCGSVDGVTAPLTGSPPTALPDETDAPVIEWDVRETERHSPVVAPTLIAAATQCDLAPRVVYHDPPQPDIDIDILKNTLKGYLRNWRNPRAHRDQIRQLLADVQSDGESASDDTSGSDPDSSIDLLAHRRKTGKIGKDIYVYYEYPIGSSTSRVLETFGARPLPQPCQLDDGQVAQLLMALDAIPFPSDPIWTPADGFAGSKYQLTDFLSRTDPRIGQLRDLVLKSICFPLHQLLDRQYATLPLLECTLFGQEVGEADSTLPRYDNSFQPGTRRISAVFTLTGAGSFEFSIGRQVTSVNLDMGACASHPWHSGFESR